MKRILFSTLFLGLAACSVDAPRPSVNGSIDTKAPSQSTRNSWDKGAMVAAADPRAVEAGLEILREGGHAVDAAIAVHAVLGLVEPQSSGLGGGAFLGVYDRGSGTTTVFDGRETAPAAIDANLFIKDGEVMGFIESWQSGRSVGVPGQIALYKTAHDAFGTASWSRLFDSGISYAEEGFTVGPRLANLLNSDRLRSAVKLDENPGSSDYFYPQGTPLQATDVRDNPDYAATLRTIATEGPAGFYRGAIAQSMVDAVQASDGTMTLEDLAGYETAVRAPLCGKFRTYRICSAPPPSSGGVAQNMIMGLYDRLLGSESKEADATDRLVALVEAQRLAYADRDHYVADADFVQVPSEDLIDRRYLDARALQGGLPGGTPRPGDPGDVLGRAPMIDMWGRDTTEDVPGTTHISIVDQNGNAVSMTATVEAAFGSSIWASGFLMNNELTDFARQPEINGKPVANAPAPGKRPRSSMSPTLVFDADDELFMVTGSPGGNSIIGYVAKTLVGVLDWDRTAQEATDLPNIIARGATVTVEVDRGGDGQAFADQLKDLGYNVRERRGENSGLHVIVVREDGLEGGADPRRNGVARSLD